MCCVFQWRWNHIISKRLLNLVQPNQFTHSWVWGFQWKFGGFSNTNWTLSIAMYLYPKLCNATSHGTYVVHSWHSIFTHIPFKCWNLGYLLLSCLKEIQECIDYTLHHCDHIYDNHILWSLRWLWTIRGSYYYLYKMMMINCDHVSDCEQ
jgi:hypothetical protein